MFNNIIYFMLALFIFHTGTADRLTVPSLWSSALGILMIGAFFGFEVRRRFRRLGRLAQGEAVDPFWFNDVTSRPSGTSWSCPCCFSARKFIF